MDSFLLPRDTGLELCPSTVGEAVLTARRRDQEGVNVEW